MAILDGQIIASSANANHGGIYSSTSGFIDSTMTDVISTYYLNNWALNNSKPADVSSTPLLYGFLLINSSPANVNLRFNCNAALNSLYQNYLSSFARFFGEGSKQDIAKIYIDKASLPRLTLGNNTAESIFVALLLQANMFESNSLISKVVVEQFKTSLVSRDNQVYINYAFVIKLYLLMIYIDDEIQNYNAPHIPDTYK